MSIARDLAEVEARLRGAPGVDWFRSTATNSLAAFPEVMALLGRMQPVEWTSQRALLLCFQALGVQHETLSPRLIDAELVATLPADSPGIARPTNQVVQQMVAGAQSEVLVLGYEVTDGSFMKRLADASRRGVDVVLICDRERGAGRRIQETWPNDAGSPRILSNVSSPDASPFAAMHAKCLLVDGRDLLITSANFTFHGLHGNIEIGVRLSGAPATEARKIFAHLVQHGLLQPYADADPP